MCDFPKGRTSPYGHIAILPLWAKESCPIFVKQGAIVQRHVHNKRYVNTYTPFTCMGNAADCRLSLQQPRDHRIESEVGFVAFFRLRRA